MADNAAFLCAFYAAYPELAENSCCRLVVVGLEIGGRFSEEAADLIRQLSFAKARAAPAYLHKATVHARERRWSRVLAISAASTYTASLLLDRAALEAEAAANGPAPCPIEVICVARHELRKWPSQLLLRMRE